MAVNSKINASNFLALLIVALLIVGALIGVKETSYANPHWETITVTDKSPSPGKEKMWLVYTEEEVYSVQDLPFAGLFHSSDIYNSLKVGQTHEVYVSGRRIPFFSSYKNIRTVK